MNWNKIKEKYPKAFEKFADWYWNGMDFELLPNGTLYFEQIYDGGKGYTITTLSVKDIVVSRRWYDFFDEQKIYIEITKYKYSDRSLRWNYEITDEQNYKYGDDIYEEENSRPEAEEQAFEKAFEILEEKLKTERSQ